MAEIAEANYYTDEDEEEDNSVVVRVFNRETREESLTPSPSASDDGELLIKYERKKSSSKAKLRVLASQEYNFPPVIKPQRTKNEKIEASLELLKGQGKYVKLNVGGSLFYTTVGTLTKHDTMLRAMFSERIPLESDEEGWVLIDRCGKQFGVILNYLRDASVSLPDTKKECEELLAEAKYYLIDDLILAVEKQLTKLKDDAHPISRVPVITCLEEERKIVSSSSKPVIKLLYNRGNNKYSYTTNSDDNLLKNIELFDKLSVRFRNRVKFMKDIVGRGEICCWAFYGNAKKITEVCCESIVYATDRKHTKIEFPEAKILDETLSIMLYEKRSDDPPIAERRVTRPPPPGTPDNVLSEDETR